MLNKMTSKALVLTPKAFEVIDLGKDVTVHDITKELNIGSNKSLLPIGGTDLLLLCEIWRSQTCAMVS